MCPKVRSQLIFFKQRINDEVAPQSSPFRSLSHVGPLQTPRVESDLSTEDEEMMA